MTTQQGSLLPARQVSRNRRQPGWWTMVLQTVWTAIHTRVTIHTLITHGGKKALPTVITRSHKTQTTNEPMFPAKGAVTCCYQLGSFSAEGVYTSGRCVAWFCLLWVVVVSFAPAILDSGQTMGLPFFLISACGCRSKDCALTASR